MTPDELAKSNSEHGHQRALFQWALVAEQYGFAVAWDYNTGMGLEAAKSSRTTQMQPVPELAWLHAIPNGGLRDKRTASMLKAEGVKRGVADVFLPLPMFARCQAPVEGVAIRYCGLYVEMKRPQTLTAGERKRFKIDQSAGVLSPEQEAFRSWCKAHRYAIGTYYDWKSAAADIEKYIVECRQNTA